MLLLVKLFNKLNLNVDKFFCRILRNRCQFVVRTVFVIKLTPMEVPGLKGNVGVQQHQVENKVHVQHQFTQRMVSQLLTEIASIRYIQTIH
jgi:hypothetical protein